MAKKRQNNVGKSSSIEPRSFQKGMTKDVNESLMPEGAYINARNAVNNSKKGDIGIIGNESANKFCTQAPYTIIGAIHLYDDEWAIFSTDDTNSEIGRFVADRCEYTTVVNDQCLGFDKKHPIIGISKENFDCTWQVYWADDLNPDRTMSMENPPFVEIPDPSNTDPDCNPTIQTDELDCERLRMARLTTPPCVKIQLGQSGGETLNGTYQAVIGYTENEQRISDYSIPSNPVSVFSHENVNGALDIVIEEIDETYDEFELVIISVINEQTVATSIGIYSTSQSIISIDRISPDLPKVPLKLIPLDRPSYERSKGIYRNGDYAIRVAPTSRFSFNYQPLANQIKTRWIAVEYPADYYHKGGVNVGHMRDEVYSYFIRWIYNTYDKTESYHIPGRAPLLGETDPVASSAYGTAFFFEENNTASILQAGNLGTTSDGGTIVTRGEMGYWESSEIYPDNKPEIWDTLCGKPIRHHKFPDNQIQPHFESGGANIYVLGVEFTEIPFPVDNDGNEIEGIIGYEILRGSRNGNKSVLAKGLINNMGAYQSDADTPETIYYQNYPYNDITPDPFLADQWITGDSAAGNNSLGDFRQDKFTFHSPDTQFKNPFLSAKELKVEQAFVGEVEGQFVEPYLHPKHKLLTDFSFLTSAVVGFGVATLAVQGEKKRTRTIANLNQRGFVGSGTTTAVQDLSALTAYSILPPLPIPGLGNQYNFLFSQQQNIEDANPGAALLNAISGQTEDTSVTGNAMRALSLTLAGISGIDGATYVDEYYPYGNAGLPLVLRLAQGIPTFLTYFNEATNKFLDIIKLFTRYEQYALANQSHGFYNEYRNRPQTYKFGIDEQAYIKDRIQEFGGITVNNLYRGSCVGLQLNGDIVDIAPPNYSVQDLDQSRFTYQSFNPQGGLPLLEIGQTYKGKTTSAYYASLKQRQRNQYGQLYSILQVPTSSCMQTWEIDPNNPAGATSEVIFGGDTYIHRYTEKNTFFYFYNWLYNLPDDTEFNYRLYKMLPYPTYWMDTREYDLQTFAAGFTTWLTGGGVGSGNPQAGTFPSNFHNLDGTAPSGIQINGIWKVKDVYMYLFNSGVRDFFVESEFNMGYRDWGDTESQRFYDPYLHTSLNDLFRTDIIKDVNFFKYDLSLSVSRLYQNFASWSRLQYRNYDPEVAETCYTFYPNRAIYSLVQGLEQRYDNWLLYLANNYKDFTSEITAIKPIAKNGAMLFFENESPIQFLGADQLQLDSGTKVTVGDGGLFSQPLQNIVNSDQPHEYGSCQNRLSIINTPAGLYWICQNQGKIFSYTGQLEEISQNGMKWWFEEFLPYKILEDFPDYDCLDNTIVGVGCQSVYNNSDGILYFCKRDFKLKSEYEGQITYNPRSGNFSLKEVFGSINLGDPRYFDDASWTVSYDPKAKAWISFHDWHPNLTLPTKNTHITTKNAGIWLHNDRSDLYCNYYGINYPFEVEMVTPTGQAVNTLRSVEYMMEVYEWGPNGVDRHHVLDFNFDRAVLYNTEQISGELDLNLVPKNNAPELLTYPRVLPNFIEILYSKEEQKYRFNQFWDITDDRGEFTGFTRRMWITDPNGYIKRINPNYVNYNKPLFERKKFRHYQSNLLLRRRVSGNKNMQLKVVNSKNQYSPR
jgi:hypothetical protein